VAGGLFEIQRFNCARFQNVTGKIGMQSLDTMVVYVHSRMAKHDRPQTKIVATDPMNIAVKTRLMQVLEQISRNK
jgi:hypothetical protein